MGEAVGVAVRVHVKCIGFSTIHSEESLLRNAQAVSDDVVAPHRIGYGGLFTQLIVEGSCEEASQELERCVAKGSTS